MPLIACPECGRQVSDLAASCIQCGFPFAPKSKPVEAPPAPQEKKFLEGNPAYDASAPSTPDWHSGPPPAVSSGTASPHVVKTAKSRGVYVILGLFFGMLGIHNFYAGYFGRGLAQLLIVCILGWFVVGLLIVFPWVIVELFVVKKDGAGDAFA